MVRNIQVYVIGQAEDLSLLIWLICMDQEEVDIGGAAQQRLKQHGALQVGSQDIPVSAYALIYDIVCQFQKHFLGNTHGVLLLALQLQPIRLLKR
jgi:hypothetical protein